jgi:F-box protein 18 (helicase)
MYFSVLLRSPDAAENMAAIELEINSIVGTDIKFPLYYSRSRVLDANNLEIVPANHMSKDKALHHMAQWIMEAVKRDQGHGIGQVDFVGVKKHSKFKMVDTVLAERFPSLRGNHACAVAALCLLAADVRDVREIIAILAASNSECARHEAHKLLYKIATFLQEFERRYGLPPRLRYLVHHALFLSENAWSYDPSQRLSADSGGGVRGLELTAEQKRVINYPVGNGGRDGAVKVLAFAGAGKTTVLRYLSLKNPSTRFLLVVFNKSVKLEAEATFPSNVECKTAHSLAWKWCSENGFATRLKNYSTAPGAIHYANVLKPRGEGSGNIFVRNAMILATLRKFATSATRRRPLFEDTPAEWYSGQSDGISERIDEKQRMVILEDANVLWHEAIANTGSSFMIEGNFYVKLFQLSNPDLRALFPYDVLLMDEGQDMNPAMLDICLRQKGLKFIVGDPNQQE